MRQAQNRTGWCRTTPLRGRGLSEQNTGAGDRLHDCRARNEVEAILWHGYSRESGTCGSARLFYELPKHDRDAVVAFLRAIRRAGERRHARSEAAALFALKNR